MSERRDVVLLGSTGSIGTQAVDVVAARTRPVPRRRGRGRRRRRRRAGRAGRRAAGAGRRRRPGRTRPTSCARRLADLWPADVARAGAARRSAARRPSWPAWAATSSSTRSPGRRGCARRSPRSTRGPTGRAGQQGIAGRRRPAGDRRWPRPGQIVPVDSEHSALAQCLRAGSARRGRAGWCSPPAAGRSAAARAASWPTSRPRRRWPTRPGTWAGSSRPTPRRWSTRASS